MYVTFRIYLYKMKIVLEKKINVIPFLYLSWKVRRGRGEGLGSETDYFTNVSVSSYSVDLHVPGPEPLRQRARDLLVGALVLLVAGEAAGEAGECQPDSWGETITTIRK